MLKKLKVSHKIVLMIRAVALLLVAATLFATVKGFNKDINRPARKEGQRLPAPLAALLDALPQHQLLVTRPKRCERPPRRGGSEVAIDRILPISNWSMPSAALTLEFTEAGLAKRKRQGNDPTP